MTVIKKNRLMSICPYCKNEVDLETCCCGDGKNGHPYDVGHNFVPLGCMCGYPKEKNNDSVGGSKTSKKD